MGQMPTADVLAIQKSKETKLEVIAPVPKEAMEPTDNAPTILLVEDNTDLQIFIKSLLDNQYKVITANNGQEAMDLLQESGKEATPLPDLILSDIMMPIMDGYQLLEKIKSNDAFHQTPVIMLTARAALADKLKAVRIGVDDSLTKPFNKEELLLRIENLLKNAAARKFAIEEVLDVSEDTSAEHAIKRKEVDQKWLDELEQQILQNIDQINLTIDDLTVAMQMSKRQLYRQINLYIGETPHQYLKSF